MREHANPGRNDRGEFLAGDDSDDARHLLGGLRIDRHDLRMRVRRAHEHHMRHARQFEIADIEPAALQQPVEIGPRNRLADIGIRPVELGQRFALLLVHEPPLRALAVASTASTIA
jgi:hypothetical protein